MDYLDNKLYLEDLDMALAAVVDLGKLRGQTVLVTGATGLIGSFLVDALCRANDCFSLDARVVASGRSMARLSHRFGGCSRSGLSLEKVDVSLPIGPERRVDYIIHAASNAHPASITSDPVGTVRANVDGVRNLLEWGSLHGCRRMLFVSSGEVYGQMPLNAPAFTEHEQGYVDPLEIRSCYPLSKRAAENLCVSYTGQFGLETVVARPCHTFGACATNSDSRAHEQFISAAAARRDVVLKSAGTQVRSYMYVADTVPGILTALVAGESCRAYNVANPDITVSVAELAQQAAQAGGVRVISEIPPVLKAHQTPISRQVLDSSALIGLGWHPRFGLGEALSRTISIRRFTEGDDCAR